MDYPPDDPFIYFGELNPVEQHGVLLALFDAAKDRPSLIREFASAYPEFAKAPKPVADNGTVRNIRKLTLSDRKSILYMTKFAEPRAGRTELAAIFDVGQQRVSQILGARGHRQPDADLLHQFNNTLPETLRDEWRVEADMQRLVDFRAGRIAANPLKPRNMTSDANPVGLGAVGRWSAYGYQFDVLERDGLFYFRIDAPGEDESNPRNSARQAIDDAFAICRAEAWAHSSGSLNEWDLAYKEDPTKAANSKNLIRVEA